jgi:hypothetical protein
MVSSWQKGPPIFPAAFLCEAPWALGCAPGSVKQCEKQGGIPQTVFDYELLPLYLLFGATQKV